MQLNYEFGGYEPDDDELENFIAEEFSEQYGIFKEVAQDIIRDYDLYDALEEDYKVEIYEFFRPEAEKYYEDFKYFYEIYTEDY